MPRKGYSQTPEHRAAISAGNIKPIGERFEEKWMPVPWTGCWLWLGYVMPNGYGMIGGGGRKGGMRLAHRVSYELHIGAIPKGMQLDHLCRVRCCVNPDHLEPVSQQENISRGSRPSSDVCAKGHVYDEPSGKYGRQGRLCMECCRVAARARYAHKIGKVQPWR